MPLVDGGSGVSGRPNVTSTFDEQINMTTSGKAAGFVTLAVESDAGTVLGGRTVKPLKVSWDSRLRVGFDTLLFVDRFVDSSPQNTAIYNSVTSTMTNGVLSGWLLLNSGLNTSNGTYAKYQTYRSFPVYHGFGTKFTCYGGFDSIPTNNVAEIGLGIAATNATPTDGLFFRLSGTNLYAVKNNAGTEVLSSAISTGLISTGVTHKFEIDIQQDRAIFSIDNSYVSTMGLTTGSILGSEGMTASNELPLLLRTYNFGVPSSAQRIRVSSVIVSQQDANTFKPYDSISNGLGLIGSQGQTGQPMGSTALYPNNFVPTAASGSNTVAALGSGLGGLFIWNADVGSHLEDYIIDSYAIPAGTSTVPGKCLYIHGVRIGTTNLALTAGPIANAFLLAYGHTSESLATSETATSKAPRFLPLGTVGMPNAAAAGSQYRTISFNFQAPVVVNPGEYVAVVSRFFAGSGLALNAEYNIGFDSSWE